MASKATSMVDSFPCRMAAAPVYGSTNSPTDPAGHTASPLMLSNHFPPGPSSQNRPSYPAILQPANDPDKQDLHRHRPLRPRRPARATTVDRGEPHARRDLQAGPRRDTRPGTVARPTRTTLRHLPASRADHPVLWVAAELDQRHIERAERRVGARLSTRASRSWPPGSRGYGPTDERPTDRIFMHRRSRGECPHLPRTGTSRIVMALAGRLRRFRGNVLCRISQAVSATPPALALTESANGAGVPLSTFLRT
jgi:hypothetical protein